MNRIRVLPDRVANQIAAGEVVERPASVLKELVENAIDAQATHIRIEIRGGGKSLIAVHDNGHGMSRDDALLCLERHATSKIYDSADIGMIHTLGFRGEAIPSIASVSRFKMFTREPGTPAGVDLDIHGGKLLSVKEAGCSEGTQIEVRNLFYNMPVRKKFMRSDMTELGHLHHVFLLNAIAHPHIAWTVLQDGKIIHELSKVTPADPKDFNQTLLTRIKALHGNQLASQLLPVNLRREGVRIQGWIGKPGLSRSNRSELYCFVNKRPVDSRAVYYGLIEGYHNALMRGRYPVCFLFLEVDPASVDVNIHPSKREVRFREDAYIQGIVIEAVRKALHGASGPAKAGAPLEMSLSKAPATTSFQPSSSTLNTGAMHRAPTPPLHAQFPFQPPQQNFRSLAPAPTTNTPSSATSALSPSFQSSSPSTGTTHRATTPTILGVLSNLYVVAMDGTGLVIMDQHAAHERILYEQMMTQLKKGSMASQKLLLPQTLELSPKDATELKSHLTVLEKMGFGIAEFGGQSFIVDAIPQFLKLETIQQTIRSVLDELNEAGHGINRDRFAEEIVAKTVCRHAVKANDILRFEELERMYSDLQACQNPLTCPHGRPTILRLTQTELEKKFGRRP